MDAFEIAHRIASTRFPSAIGVWLSGSSAAGRSGAASDVDVVVVVRDAQPFRETGSLDGQLVELFVQTETSLAEWYATEARDYRCTLAHMLATGHLVVGDEQANELQLAARRHVDVGPRERPVNETDSLRYHLSAAMDDLAGCTDDDERVFIAHEVVALASDLELAMARSWTGRGRWRHRWLRGARPDIAHRLAESLSAARDDQSQLIGVASDVLERAGGRLQEGYRLG